MNGALGKMETNMTESRDTMFPPGGKRSPFTPQSDAISSGFWHVRSGLCWHKKKGGGGGGGSNRSAPCPSRQSKMPFPFSPCIRTPHPGGGEIRGRAGASGGEAIGGGGARAEELNAI